jgi:hypothetical protein
MAQKENILQKLGKLFQSNIIVRRRGDGKLVVKDLDFTQTSLASNFIDRYSKIVGGGSWGAKYASRQNISNYDVLRRELFKDYDVMDSDPIIASALDIYADESTIDNMEGEIITITSDNPAVVDILHNLFYNILNLEFNLWSWIRNLVKYGDFYLWLDILDKHGVMNIRPISPFEVVRLEDHDPEHPKKIEFEIQGNGSNHYGSMSGGQKLILQDYEVAHFRLASDANFLPYGKSMLESARKAWKQLTLMEDAMLIHRIMRAPEKRIFKIDIGNIPPNEVDGYMQKIINKMKKIPVIDQATGEYNLKYNVESVTEDYYLPVRGSDSGTSIDTLPGLTTDGAIDDIEYIRNKMMAALKIPKAFLGYEEGVGSKATLAAEDVRFARTIERLQKIIVSELHKIAIVHLKVQGFDDVDLIDFDLELQNPSMIHLQEKLELMTQKNDLATSLIENKMVSREWVYKHIFEFDKTEQQDVFDQIIEDQKQAFRMEQITTEGNDPAKTGEKDMSSNGSSGGVFGESSWGGSEKNPTRHDINPHGSSKEDLKQATSHERERYGKRDFKHGSPLHPGKGATLVKSEMLDNLQKKFNTDFSKVSMLNENAVIDD